MGGVTEYFSLFAEYFWLVTATHYLDFITLVVLMFNVIKRESSSGLSLYYLISMLASSACELVNITTFTYINVVHIAELLVIMGLIYLSLFRNRKRFDRRHEDKSSLYLIVFSVFVGAAFTHPFEFKNAFHHISLWIQSFSIFPQSKLVKNTQQVSLFSYTYLIIFMVSRLLLIISAVVLTLKASTNVCVHELITTYINIINSVEFLYSINQSENVGNTYDLPL